MSTVQFIAYYRVSTQRQGASGLGLDAQRKATAHFVKSSDGALTNEYTEIESGKAKDRPQLDAAIAACRRLGATLLIAKLDRLARNVAFIANLLESGVRFIAVDMPNADKFMMHVYAAMGEEEGRRISERTRAALAAAKERGVRLGANAAVLAQEAKSLADRFALENGFKIASLRRHNSMSYQQIANYLNESQFIPSQRGGNWHASSVHRLLKRYSQLKNN